MEIRKITGVVKKSAGIWWESEGPWKRPWYKFLLCVCVAWVEKLRTSRFNFAPVPIRLESVGDSRPTLVTAFNLNSQEFNLLDYLWGSANWFHSSSEIFLLDFLSVSLCIAIGAGGKKRERKCKKRGVLFLQCNGFLMWSLIAFVGYRQVWFLFWWCKRERERYVESKIFLNELEIRFSNCDFGIKKGFDGKLRIWWFLFIYFLEDIVEWTWKVVLILRIKYNFSFTSERNGWSVETRWNKKRNIFKSVLIRIRKLLCKIYLLQIRLWNKNIFPGWTKLNGEVRAKYVGKGN